MILTSTVFDSSIRVTDRRMDGIAIAYARIAYMLSCAMIALQVNENWIKQESPAVTDKPARHLQKVCTVYIRAVGC